MADSISEKSRISLPVGLMITILVTFCGGTSAVIYIGVGIDASIDHLGQRMARMEETYRVGAYTKAEAAEAALRLSLQNPMLNVPDPRNPSENLRKGAK